MRDHAIVSPHFWTGDTGRQLRQHPEAQRVAFYLMTCPSSNMIGLYYLPIPLICHEVGLSEEGAWKALARLSEVDFCAYDAPSETVFVKQMARYQIGERLTAKDNRYLAVQRLLAKLRNSVFYNDFLERYNAQFTLNLLPTISPSQAPSEPLPSKDQEKDKEKEVGETHPPAYETTGMPAYETIAANVNGVMRRFKAPRNFVPTEARREQAARDAPHVNLDLMTKKFKSMDFQKQPLDWQDRWYQMAIEEEEKALARGGRQTDQTAGVGPNGLVM